MEKDRVKQIATAFVANFGEYYDPDPYYINGTSDPYHKHENYGLTIGKY